MSVEHTQSKYTLYNEKHTKINLQKHNPSDIMDTDQVKEIAEYIKSIITAMEDQCQQTIDSINKENKEERAKLVKGKANDQVLANNDRERASLIQAKKTIFLDLLFREFFKTFHYIFSKENSDLPKEYLRYTNEFSSLFTLLIENTQGLAVIREFKNNNNTKVNRQLARILIYERIAQKLISLNMV